MSYKSQIFDLLKLSDLSMTWEELVKQIPGSCGTTVSRALRKLFEQGCVTRRPVDPKKPMGMKAWKIIPNAVHPTRSRNPKQLSLPVSAGKINIVTPTTVPTLVSASEAAILALVNDQKPFTAHDITKILRSGVNDGMDIVDANEVGTVFVNGKKVARITHDEVKAIVHQAFSDGKMPGYERTVGALAAWEYRPSPTTVVASPASYNGTSLL